MKKSILIYGVCEFFNHLWHCERNGVKRSNLTRSVVLRNEVTKDLKNPSLAYARLGRLLRSRIVVRQAHHPEQGHLRWPRRRTSSPTAPRNDTKERNLHTALFISLLLITFISSASLGFAIDNLLAEGLRDVKAPVYFPSNTLFLIIVIFALLAGGMYALMRFLKTKKEEVEEVPVDPRLPWEIAYDQFDELAKSSLLEEGQFKVYYSRLSGIIRQYFENQFKVKAPEMTTEEFLWSLEKSRHLTANQNDTLRQFLDSCDIVKFAKFIPRIEEGKESFLLARKLVEEIKIVVDAAGSVSGK